MRHGANEGTRATGWYLRACSGLIFTLGLAMAAMGQAVPALPARPSAAPLPRAAGGEDFPTRTIAPGLRLVGPNQAVEVFGVKFVGVNAENGQKLLLTLAYIAVVLLLGRGARAVVGRIMRDRRDERVAFWARQGIRLGTAVLLILGLVSIWFDDPTRLATALGLVTAGLAFALQKVVTAFAGYFVILRGKTFNVGDRITMGGVRGDVIALGFIQTTIMEMGQPPAVEATPTRRCGSAAGSTRGESSPSPTTRSSTSRSTTTPTSSPTSGRRCGCRSRTPPTATGPSGSCWRPPSGTQSPAGEMGIEALDEMKRRYFMKPADISPRVYYRLTDNWLELTVRFVVRDHGIRDVKDAMSRDIIKALDEAGIGIASATFEIVGLPPVRIQETGSMRAGFVQNANGPGQDRS